MTKPTIELLSGILSAIAGAADVAYSVLGKTYVQQIDDGLETRVRLLDLQELEPITIVALVVLALLPILVGVGAYRHCLIGVPAGRRLVLVATGLYLVAFWLTGLSMGPNLLAGVVLAVVTSVVAIARGGQDQGQQRTGVP